MGDLEDSGPLLERPETGRPVPTHHVPRCPSFPPQPVPFAAQSALAPTAAADSLQEHGFNYSSSGLPVAASPSAWRDVWVRGRWGWVRGRGSRMALPRYRCCQAQGDCGQGWAPSRPPRAASGYVLSLPSPPTAPLHAQEAQTQNGGGAAIL